MRIMPLAALLLATAASAAPPAGNSLPAWTPPPRREVPLADTPWPGTIQLEVDARDVVQGVFRVRETIPVAAAGPLVLRYPQWLQANHAPTGPIAGLSGLRIAANGRAIAWRRDPVDMYAFHVEVPAGARALEVTFESLTPSGAAPGNPRLNRELFDLQWNRVLLHPAGHFVRRIEVRAAVTLPDGFTGVSAVDGSPRTGRIAYPATDLETLVDSPLYAGRHFRAWTLRPGVDLNVVADRAESLAATPAQIEAHGRMVDQTVKLFGSRHYDRYDFLLALTDTFGGGIEHHRSSENGTPPGYFTDWDNTASLRGLLPHEYAHSWNGKYRRPAATWRPDYHVPIENELLWVYEGQTSFWDVVLAARAGMVPKEAALGEIASTAAGYAAQEGRAWRPLADTVNQPIIAYGQGQAFPSWQRGTDYYGESSLIWLEADMLIRAESRGARSLDDFARAFFGGADGNWGVVTYTRADLVAALNRVQPHDWEGFFRARIDAAGAAVPTAGITRGGYRLVWKETPNPYDQSAMRVGRRLDLAHSIGATVRDGSLSNIAWDGPLFRAGLTGGATIAAVNGAAYSDDALKAAITATKGGRDPIRLLVKEGGRFREIALDYHGGLRWPWIEKAVAGDAPLDRLLAPL